MINDDFAIIDNPDEVHGKGSRSSERDGFCGTLLSGGLGKDSPSKQYTIAALPSSPAGAILEDDPMGSFGDSEFESSFTSQLY